MKKTLSQLRKEAQQAPKYVLQVADGFYVNEKGNNVTQDAGKALQYSVGYDNENMKLSYWNHALNTTLTVKYL